MNINDYTRRDFLKAVGFGAASLAMPGCTSAAELSANEAAPEKEG